MCAAAAEAVAARDASNQSGMAYLIQSLLQALRRCGGIPDESYDLLRRLVDDPAVLLHPLHVRMNGGAQTRAVTLWHRGGAQRATLLLFDLACDGGEAVVLPSQELLAAVAPRGGADSELVRVEVEAAVRPTRPQDRAPAETLTARRADPASPDELSVFSIRELRQGQLHASLPASGVLCLTLSALEDDCSSRSAHLLSGLRRLCCRPREHACDNDLGNELMRCWDAPSQEGARRLGRILYQLDAARACAPQLKGAANLAALGRMLCAGLHLAAASAPLRGAVATFCQEDCSARISKCDGLISVEEAAVTAHEVEVDMQVAETLYERACSLFRGDMPRCGQSGALVSADRSPTKCDLSPNMEHILVIGNANESPSATKDRPIRNRPNGSSRLESIGIACLEAFASDKRTSTGSTVFVTPEVGSWCTVGGLGVMVQHLSQAIAEKGAPVIVIAPAYTSCANQWRNASSVCSFVVPMGSTPCVVNVLLAQTQGPTIYLLHSSIFDVPYPQGEPLRRILPSVLLARGALLLLRQLAIHPAAIVTNDWVAGLTAPYARHTAWAGTAAPEITALERSSLFVHLIHNLEPGYNGELRMPEGFKSLHQLPTCILHEEGRSGTLSISRAALLSCCAWATVSEGYRRELLEKSSFAPLLRQMRTPVAFPSGIPLARRRAELQKFGGHCNAKAALQKLCFGPDGVKDVPLLCFLGRVAHQKGVHLLLDCVPALLQVSAGQVQILVCGRADPTDPYAACCASQMSELRASHPANFWAQPNKYFEQGELASVGADFGVMPSLFEPCGLVREEFFAAGTPLIASNTGGLGDRVQHYRESDFSGSGLLFNEHTHTALLRQLAHALSLYRSQHHYEALRRNAFAASCDIAHTASFWTFELQRLRACKASQQFTRYNSASETDER